MSARGGKATPLTPQGQGRSGYFPLCCTVHADLSSHRIRFPETASNTALAKQLSCFRASYTSRMHGCQCVWWIGNHIGMGAQ